MTNALSNQSSPLRWLPWVAALGGLLFTVGAFYPGYMSWDSASQWQQAISGDMNDVNPPLMTLLWSATSFLIVGPGGMFLLQCLLYWSLLGALFGRLTALTPVWRSLLVLAIGCLPTLWGVLPHVWKDVWMALAFGWAAVVLLNELRAPSIFRLLIALLLVTLACSLRVNAISGAVPLLVWIVWRGLSLKGYRISSLALVGGCAVLSISVYLVAQLPNQLPGVRQIHDKFSVVALWDMAAISIEDRTMAIPPTLRQRDFSIDELATRFRDYTNVSLYGNGMLRHSFLVDYNEAQRRAMYVGWLDAVRQHPRAYLSHRWRLSRLLFGIDRGTVPDEFTLGLSIIQLDGTPPLKVTRNGFQQRTEAWLKEHIHGLFFAGWIYVVLAAATCLSALRKISGQARQKLIATLALSGLCYALPLSLLSGSAEFRYLFWLVLASLMSAVVQLDSWWRLRRSSSLEPKC